MVRHYVRTTSRLVPSQDQIKEALKKVLEGWSIRKASTYHEVDRNTVQRAFKKLKTTGNVNVRPLHSERIFSDPQEDALVDYIINSCKMFYGLPVSACLKIAYEMATINKIKTPESWTRNETAGKDWWYNFMKRNKTRLSLRQHEHCILSRAAGFNLISHGVFFSNLQAVLERLPSFKDGTRIYNLDEISKTTVGDPIKASVARGEEQVSKIKSTQCGEIVTICPIICSNGTYIPPVMIFPRKNFKQSMLNGAPLGTLGLVAPQGSMDSPLFSITMQHFINHTNSCEENPTLLILDNHESHLSIAALDLAKKHHVTILIIPPQTSHKLQPLDVAVFSLFNTACNEAIEEWQLKNPGQHATIYEMAAFLGKAHDCAMTPKKIRSSFRKTGIFPYNPEIFTPDDFSSSLPTPKKLQPLSSPLPSTLASKVEAQWCIQDLSETL